MHFKNIENGYIYIFQNRCFAPDILKIGKTTRCVYDRARQLSRETGVPEDFTVAYSKQVWDIAQAEDSIFLRLRDFRRHSRKEFFQLPLAAAVTAADEIIAEINSQQPENLIQRHRRWEDFEHYMREREEAARQYYGWKQMLKQDYPEQAAWMFPYDEEE
jgi:hypothetical protein